MTVPKTIRRAAERLLLGSLLLSCAAAVALEPSTSLANYGRQAWAMENGLPQNTVQALAQTQDGFLWLGTEAGLVRFDGVEFQTYDHNSNPALPGSDIRALLATRDGALWIGTNAGLARWKDGAVRVFTTADGLPANGILALVTVESGAVGAWTEQGPAQMAGDRFEAVRNVDALPHTALPSSGEYPGAIAFEEELPGELLVMGDRNSLDFARGREHPAQRIASQHRPGASRQPHSGGFCRSRRRALDRHECRAGAVGERQGRTLSRHRSAGHRVDPGAHGRPRGRSVGGD